nr:MAG TPA: hypothetical protein [Bacteriophage sp.]
MALASQLNLVVKSCKAELFPFIAYIIKSEL